MVSSYGMMALIDLQGENARWMLHEHNRKESLWLCVRDHLSDSLE